MKISYQITLDDIHEYVKYVNGLNNKKKLLGRIFFLGLVFAVVLGPVGETLLNSRNGVLSVYDMLLPRILFILPGMGFAYLLLYFQNKKLAKATFTVNRELAAPKEIELHEEGISTTSIYMDTMLKWNLFERVAETDNLLLLFISKNNAQVIPKRAFANEHDLAEFRTATTAKIGIESSKRTLPDHLVGN